MNWQPPRMAPRARAWFPSNLRCSPAVAETGKAPVEFPPRGEIEPLFQIFLFPGFGRLRHFLGTHADDGQNDPDQDRVARGDVSERFLGRRSDLLRHLPGKSRCLLRGGSVCAASPSPRPGRRPCPIFPRSAHGRDDRRYGSYESCDRRGPGTCSASWRKNE